MGIREVVVVAGLLAAKCCSLTPVYASQQPSGVLNGEVAEIEAFELICGQNNFYDAAKASSIQTVCLLNARSSQISPHFFVAYLVLKSANSDQILFLSEFRGIPNQPEGQNSPFVSSAIASQVDLQHSLIRVSEVFSYNIRTDQGPQPYQLKGLSPSGQGFEINLDFNAQALSNDLKFDYSRHSTRLDHLPRTLHLSRSLCGKNILADSTSNRIARVCILSSQLYPFSSFRFLVAEFTDSEGPQIYSLGDFNRVNLNDPQHFATSALISAVSKSEDLRVSEILKLFAKTTEGLKLINLHGRLPGGQSFIIEHLEPARPLDR